MDIENAKFKSRNENELDQNKINNSHKLSSVIGIELRHPVAFFIGVTLLSVGVLLHLPEFFSMKTMGYRMAQMPMSSEMLWGMAAIVLGLVLSAFGVLPRLSSITARKHSNANYHIHAMDNAKLSKAHWWLLFVLGVALVIDVMKPATLGFIMPGMRREYGLTTAQVSIFPLVALTGTIIGSIFWGVLADRVGRRASILLASLIFIGSSICGFMPTFEWNIAMCGIMGLAAGGMLPIVYSLMAETVPAKMRGWLVIVHGGLGTVCGYLVASGLAALFEPEYTWRILWFFGLPTGLMIIFMNRWIPESPRFLLERGKSKEAQAVMSRFGIIVEQQATKEAQTIHADPQVGCRSRILSLFQPPYTSQSFTILLYGIGWGLVNWGFLTFLPIILRDAGFPPGAGSGLLFKSMLMAIPGIVLVAFLYGKWSSRKTMILFSILTSIAMIAFAFMSPILTSLSKDMIVLLIMSVMVSSTAVISMLSPYAAEVYPTALRGTGSGIAAGGSKLGGVIALPVMGLLLPVYGAMLPIAAMGVPMAVAGLVLYFGGIETKGRGLEQIAEKYSVAHRRQLSETP